MRDHGTHLARAARQTLSARTARLDGEAERARRASLLGLEVAGRRVAEHSGRVTGAARSHLRAADLQVEAARRRVAHRAPRGVADAERSLAGLEARVRALDPERTLARGWSITRRADGQVVRNPADVGAGEALATTVAGGEVRSTVTTTSTVSPDG